MGPINRDHRFQRYSLGLVGNLAKQAEIDFAGFCSGTITLKSGSNVTSITFYGSGARPNTSPPEGGAAQTAQATSPFQPLYDNTIAAVTFATVTGAQIIQFPDACFGCGALKLVATFSSGSQENCDISLKG